MAGHVGYGYLMEQRHTGDGVHPQLQAGNPSNQDAEGITLSYNFGHSYYVNVYRFLDRVPRECEMLSLC
jgi:hypothetical protein